MLIKTLKVTWCWLTVYSSCTGVTGLMKTVRKQRRHASMKISSEHKRPAQTQNISVFILTEIYRGNTELFQWMRENLAVGQGWCDSPPGTWCCSLCPWPDCPTPPHIQSSTPDWTNSAGEDKAVYKQTYTHFISKHIGKTSKHKTTTQKDMIIM